MVPDSWTSSKGVEGGGGMLPLRESGSAKRVSTKFVVFLKVCITTENLFLSI